MSASNNECDKKDGWAGPERRSDGPVCYHQSVGGRDEREIGSGRVAHLMSPWELIRVAEAEREGWDGRPALRTAAESGGCGFAGLSYSKVSLSRLLVGMERFHLNNATYMVLVLRDRNLTQEGSSSIYKKKQPDFFGFTHLRLLLLCINYICISSLFFYLLLKGCI